MKERLMLLLLVVIFISGCVKQEPTIAYKNDIITIEKFSISDRTPYAGSITSIDFTIQNNGDQKVKEVRLIFKPQGFTFSTSDLYCQPPSTFIENGRGCLFSNLRSLDGRRVSLTLHAPPKELITNPTAFTVDFSVNYYYSGRRVATIPIIDGKYRTTPLGQFSQSTPTFGPILLDFEPPVGGERIEDSRVIKEYWGVIDRPFKVEMNFRHVGSISVGKVEPINLSLEKIKLNLKTVKIEEKLPCDLISKKSIIIEPTGAKTSLICNFKAEGITEPETTAEVEIEYGYKYEFSRTEKFTVQPLKKE